MVILPDYYLEDAGDVLQDYADGMKRLPWGTGPEAPSLSLFDTEAIYYLKECDKEFDGHFLVDRTGRIYDKMVYVTSIDAGDLDSSYDGAKMRSLEEISTLDVPGVPSHNGDADEIAYLRQFPEVYDGTIDAPVDGEVLSTENLYGPVVGAAIRASTGEIDILSRGERIRSLDPIVPSPSDTVIHHRINNRVSGQIGESPFDVEEDPDGMHGFEIEDSDGVTIEEFLSDDFVDAAAD
jgi:hypothetical protein